MQKIMDENIEFLRSVDSKQSADTYAHVYAHTRTHARTHTHTHARMHTRVCTHTQAPGHTGILFARKKNTVNVYVVLMARSVNMVPICSSVKCWQ